MFVHCKVQRHQAIHWMALPGYRATVDRLSNFMEAERPERRRNLWGDDGWGRWLTLDVVIRLYEYQHVSAKN